MTAVELIQKKRDGRALSDTEIKAVISGYTGGDIPDYQMSAFLMAVYFQGMSDAETASLTELMRDSGIVLDLSDLPAPKVDKHSTGGVGDKVSLVLAPLVAACGVTNPMISGRSLAHTGGTLDKLEAIPGFNTQLDLATFKAYLKARKVALIGQTKDICPADKKIYALRDATGTVQSIPLICGSILSKKLAEDLDALVLDVKCGSGAIFPDPAYSEKLAHKLVQTAAKFGLKTVALLTQMEQPLGVSIGTWLETREAVDMLAGKPVARDFYNVTIALSAYMVWLGGLAPSFADAKEHVEHALQSGAALQRFREIVSHQGGDISILDAPGKYPAASHQCDVLAESSGFVHGLHARTFGQVAMLLGAGRRKKEDGIDYTAGILLNRKVGDRVQVGEKIATLFASQQPIASHLVERIQTAINVATEPCQPLPVFLGIVDENGKQVWSHDRYFNG